VKIENEFDQLKWCADGAKTLSETAARLRLFADELDELAESGWTLTMPVDKGHLLLERGSGAWEHGQRIEHLTGRVGTVLRDSGEVLVKVHWDGNSPDHTAQVPRAHLRKLTSE
jgi:hypothetical protein